MSTMTTTENPLTSKIVKRTKLGVGHYHVESEWGEVFWVARVRAEDFDGQRTVWQIGTVGKDGSEDAPFDAGRTMTEVLEYLN